MMIRFQKFLSNVAFNGFNLRPYTTGLKDWSMVRQPSNTVNACCSNDPAFVKVAPGRVGLAALGRSLEVAPCDVMAPGVSSTT